MSATYKDLQFTSFPDSVQSFVTMLNMATTDAVAVSGYQAAMEAGNTSLAQQYYSQIVNADSKFIDATKMNTIMNTVVALQRFYLTDIKPYIQTKQTDWENIINRFSYAGDYAVGTQYQVNNFVTYTVGGEKQVFICTSNPPVGATPTNTNYWRPLTIKGATGQSGAGLTFRYEWSSSENYYAEDVVTYNNTVWNCLKDNKNVLPGSDSKTWQLIYTTSQDIYPFQSDEPTNISAGDLWFQIV